MSDYYYYNNENDGYRGGFGEYNDPIPTSGGPVGPEAPRQKDGGKKKVVALLLACALVGGCAGAGGAAVVSGLGGGNKTTIYEGERPQVQTVVDKNTAKTLTPEQLYAASLPSCVGITVSTTKVNIFGQTSTSAASGSGFVLTEDGYIVTNYHVIEEAVKDTSVTVEVAFANGQKFTAKVVGGEADNDVAVLKIETTGLTPVTLGDSEKLVVGEMVYAIGNPLGELTYSFTDGMVSALDRLITTSESNAQGQTVTKTFNVLQTNAAINPGNSGGPLFDSYGNVVGIVSAKYTQSQSGVSAEGLGFALPINDVKQILADLIEHGYVTGKPYLGIQVMNVSEEAQRYYGVVAGAAVKYVAEGSCSAKAGLIVGDIITAIDDKAIDSSTALTAALSANYRAGDTVTLTVVRQQETLSLSVTLDEKNSETEAGNQIEQGQQSQQGQQYQQGQGGYYSTWPFGGFFPGEE